jgi:hypothetical protein
MIINATAKSTRKRKKKDATKLSPEEQQFKDFVPTYSRHKYTDLADLIKGNPVRLYIELRWDRMGVETVRAVKKYLAAFDSPPKLDEVALANLLRGLPPERTNA